MAQELHFDRGGVGKVRSFWVGLGLSIITLGIYGYVWYYLINDEVRDVGRSRGDEKLAESNPALSVVALLAGSFVIIPGLITLWTYGKRLERAQTVAGVAESERFKPLPAYLLIVPGALLVIPAFVYYWYVTKHQNAAVRATAGLPPFGGGASPAAGSPSVEGLPS